ncbi:MAG: hypothetical protein WA347_04830 [Rhabdochlamydiaceae bacterium]
MAVQFNVKDFLSALTCPIELDPLTQAVNLFPCCHKVNQIAAEKYYGKIVNGFCGLSEKNCVICNTQVVAYAPDHTIRDLAARAFGHEKDLESLPNHSLVLEEKKSEIDQPYPGLPAVFVHMGGSWDKFYDSGGELCRMMEFKSITNNSLLQNFKLLGYCNGDVSISILFQKSKAFVKYLLAHHIDCDEHIAEFCRSTTPEHLKTIFRIISLNNEIPGDKFNQIREIVERGCCDPSPMSSFHSHHSAFEFRI